MRLRLAASVALRMASGTSRALPWPNPTRPFWSPTTTSAAKPKRLPPLTTLATRLMCTSLSTNSLSRSRSSRSRPPRAPATWSTFSHIDPLEIETALAGGVCERLHAPMIKIAAAIEHDVLDPCLQCALGDQLADGARGRDVAAFLERGLQVLIEARSGSHRLPVLVVDHL